MFSLPESGRERSAEELATLLNRAGLTFERAATTPGPIRLFIARNT